MNLKHLGDALDFWKGAIIETLRDHLNDIHVLPMFTDENVRSTWNRSRLQLYARLLRVDAQQILRSQDSFPGPKRADYFQDLDMDVDDDVFADPDTGIEPESGGDAGHICLSEVGQLVPDASKRVVFVYQHAFRKNNWVDTCLQRIVRSSFLTGCKAFAYRAGSVSMLLVSRENERLADLHQTLHRLSSPLPPDLARLTPITR